MPSRSSTYGPEGPRRRPRARVRPALALALAAAAAALLASACQPGFRDQPYYRAHDASALFPDGNSARPRVEGTVAQGELDLDSARVAGVEHGRPVTEFPVPVTAELLARGRERYDIFCSPCHDRRGTGHGMVVQRGFPPPPSYHSQRLRNAPPGHFFDVISHGFGMMKDYGDRIPPADRWAIVAYIRALQLSDRVDLARLDPAVRDSLLGARP